MASAPPNTLVNGQPGDTLSVYDRGIAYGHGLFETIRVYQGRPQLWEAHMQRLLQGCILLGIQLPPRFEQALLNDVHQLCGSGTEAVIKIIVTAGCGGRGYLPPLEMACQRIVSLFPLPVYPEIYGREGVRVRTCNYRLPHNPRLAGIKHLNRLDQVLSRSEWQDTAIAEGIVLDCDGQVVEGTMSNLFGVRGDELLTPCLERCGVKGVMRDFILATASAQGIVTREVRFAEEEFKVADELFLTNSVIGLWPVRQWDDHCYPRGVMADIFQRAIARLAVESAAGAE